MSGYVVLLSAVAIVTVYAILVRRLSSLAHRMRCKLVQAGEDLLSSGRLNQEQRDSVLATLDRAFSSVDAWLIAALIIPATALSVADQFRGIETPVPAGGEGIVKKWLSFQKLGLLVRLMNSPLALAIAMIEAAIVLITFAPMMRVAARLARLTADVEVRSSTGRNHHHA